MTMSKVLIIKTSLRAKSNKALKAIKNPAGSVGVFIALILARA